MARSAPLEAISKAAGGLVGGDAGEGLELFGALDDAGVSADKASTMAAQFLKMVKEHVDDDLLQSILSQIPALKPFLN